MFRPASRALLRAPAPSAAFRPAPRRLLSTSAKGKSRSWKNTAVRLGLAIGAVYYYNTSSVFAEHSLCMLPSRERAAHLPLLTQICKSSLPQTIPPIYRRLSRPNSRLRQAPDPRRASPIAACRPTCRRAAASAPDRAPAVRPRGREPRRPRRRSRPGSSVQPGDRRD